MIPARTNMHPAALQRAFTIAQGSPLDGAECPACDRILVAGDEVRLVMVGAEGSDIERMQAGRQYAASTVAVHVEELP